MQGFDDGMFDGAFDDVLDGAFDGSFDGRFDGWVGDWWIVLGHFRYFSPGATLPLTLSDANNCRKDTHLTKKLAPQQTSKNATVSKIPFGAKASIKNPI